MYSKLDFSKDALNHLQGLINLSDIKTGLLLTVVAIITASFFGMFVPVIDSGISILGYILTISYLLSFIVTTSFLLGAVRPRIGKTSDKTTSGSIFFGDILQSKNESEFRSRFQGVTEESMAEDFSNNVYALAKILDQKLNCLNRGIIGLKVTIFIWAISILGVIFRIC